MLFTYNKLRYLRHLSTKLEKDAKLQADVIKKVNYENKALFGPVQKSKKGDVNPTRENQSPETEFSSEIYWLLEYKHTRQANEKKSAKTAKGVKSQDNSNKPGARSSSKSKEQIFHNNLIPFNKKGLKSILKFPIISHENDHVFKSGPVEFAGSYPSVSKILQATMSERARKALMDWKLSKIAELGEEGFNQMQQDHLQRGKMLHEALQSYLTTGTRPEIQPRISELWESVLPALESLKPTAELTEVKVEHPFLKYKGVVDCVSRIGDDLSVIEWKKSDKHKISIESTYDAPVQLTAYLGALSADPRHKLIAKQGYIVVAYSDSKPAEIHHMDEIQLRKYWDIWLKKVQEFWIRTRDGTLPEPI